MAQQQPTVDFKPVEVKNVEWKDAQFRFDGKWLPELDGYLIGPNNYQELSNMRYLDTGIEGVSGYSKINTVSLANHATLGNFPYIRNGYQHRTIENGTAKTYTFVHALNSSDLGRLFLNTTAISSQGNFNTTLKLDTSGHVYFEDSESGRAGRFSDAPQGNMVYSNGVENEIFGGVEQNLSALYTVDNSDGDNAKDYTDRAVNSLSDSENIWTVDAASQGFMVVSTTRPIQGLKIYVHRVQLVH